MRASAISLRPVLLSAATLAISAALIGVAPDYPPFGAYFRYALEVFVALAVIVGVSACWYARRRGSDWDADLIPALAGAVATFTLLGMLHGTPWGPNGLDGDQSFRTEFVTRFASSWQNADYTFAGLPAFYAPAYFWILGRSADLLGLEPWRTIKYGAVVSAALVPLVTYLLWRPVAPKRAAAVISIVPLVVAVYDSPYSWLVMFAIVPWWVLVMRGAHGPSLERPSPIVLGLIGGILFLTYYYFFFVIGVAIVIYLLGLWATGARVASRMRYLGITLAVTALTSMIFWLPLVASVLTIDGAESFVNRYFGASYGLPEVPFMTSSPLAAVSLLGLVYLILTRRSLTSRALICLLAAVVAWWLVGFATALAGFPIVTVRSQSLISIILFSAGILALGALGRLAARRVSPRTRPKVRVSVAVMAAVFALVAARSYVATIAESDSIVRAHTTPLPDGRLPSTAPSGAQPATVSVNAIRDIIDSRFAGGRPPVVLSTRPDVLALTPYYGFNQWQVYYAHPASRFRGRIAFLQGLADLGDPEAFTRLSATNPFDGIDAFVLKNGGDAFTFEYHDENFPDASRKAVIAFPRQLFEPKAFDITDLGPYVVVVRR